MREWKEMKKLLEGQEKQWWQHQQVAKHKKDGQTEQIGMYLVFMEKKMKEVIEFQYLCLFKHDQQTDGPNICRLEAFRKKKFECLPLVAAEKIRLCDS